MPPKINIDALFKEWDSKIVPQGYGSLQKTDDANIYEYSCKCGTVVRRDKYEINKMLKGKKINCIGCKTKPVQSITNEWILKIVPLGYGALSVSNENLGVFEFNCKCGGRLRKDKHQILAILRTLTQIGCKECGYKSQSQTKLKNIGIDPSLFQRRSEQTEEKN